MKRTSWSLGSRLLVAAAVSVLLGAAAASAVNAAPIYTENFSYVAPSSLNGQGGWSAHSSAGTNPQTVNAGSLSFPGYPGSGIGNLLGPTATSGEDNNHGFTGQSSGSVYAAFLVKVTSAQATGDYFLHTFDGPIAGNIFRSRVFVKSSGANLAFGIQFGSTVNTVYTPATFTTGTTYLMVVKYTFVAGLLNDKAALFVNPVISNVEPAATVSTSDPTQTDAVNLDGIAIRQGGGAQAASVSLDGIRVATNWADAVGAHTITASAGAGGSISPSGAVSVADGANQTFTISPNDKCHVIADVIVDGSSVGPVSTFTFNNVTADHTISATFSTLGPFTITASAGPGGSIGPSGLVSVNCGASQSFTITPSAGYHTVDVVVDGSSVGPVASYTFSDVQANHTISATFAVDPTVIGAQSTSTYICPLNPCVALPVTIARGASDPVLGFSVTIQLSPNLSLCNVTGSITEGTFLSSQGPTTFQIINNGGGSYTVDGALLANCGQTASSGTLFNVGVTSSDPGGIGTITTTTTLLRDCNNVPLPANPGTPGTVPIDNQAPVVTVTSPNGGESWLIGSSQKISWTASDNTSVASIDLAYSTDGGATYPNVIATGLPNTGTFVWTVPNTPIALARVRATAHDAACSSGDDASDANFTIRDPVIVATAGPGGSISPSGTVSVPYGTNQTFLITPSDKCHTIADVKVDGVSVGPVASYTFTGVTVDHTIAASFSVLGPFTITASADPGATISPSGAVSVPCGGSQTFSITTDKCHVLADVKVDGVSVGPVTSYTFTDVQANHTIHASVTALGPYTILASAGTGGTISPSGSVSVNCGASQKFDIAPDKCHVLADVKVDGVSVGPVATYTFLDVQTNHTIDASFTEIGPFTITATAGTGGSIAPSGAVTVPCGGSQAFTITPNAGYAIADVKVDNVSVGPVGSYTFLDVQANHTIAASFLDVQCPSVTVIAPNGSEILIVGSLAKLAWTATDNSGTVTSIDLWISRDNGNTYLKIASNIPNSGTYTWLVDAPGTNTGPNPEYTALFRVDAHDAANNVCSDVSDAPFALQDLATAVTLSMFQASPIGDAIELRWQLGEPGTFSSLLIERSEAEAGPWSEVALDRREESGVMVALDRAVQPEKPYYYRLVGVMASAQRVVLGRISGSARMRITELSLAKVSPNPSRDLMRIEYALPRETNVRLSILDVQGREVALLASGVFHAGRYQATWTGQTDRGEAAPAGIYFVRVAALGKTLTQRIVRTH